MFLNEDALSDDSSFEDYISVSPPATMELNTQAQQGSQQVILSNPEHLSHASNGHSDTHSFGQLIEFLPASLGNANPNAIPVENALALPEISAQG